MGDFFRNGGRMQGNPLVGTRVVSVFLTSDKKAIKFHLDTDEDIIAYAEGDCCSVTWIENVENVEALIDRVVLTAENIDMPRESKETDGELTQFYGFKIETANGTCTLDYRNSSNGYYGGSLSWPGYHYYAGVYDQNASTNEWVKLGG
jgi:hypothetical protein